MKCGVKPVYPACDDAVCVEVAYRRSVDRRRWLAVAREFHIYWPTLGDAEREARITEAVRLADEAISQPATEEERRAAARWLATRDHYSTDKSKRP
jgi:hypothetical protein